MKTFFCFFFALGCYTTSAAQDLEVLITNIHGTEGILMVGLFNTESTFMKVPWKGEKLKAKSGTATVMFHDLPPGAYAISVFHDANENGKLDANFIGIPKEGVGFSNDAMGLFGPPSFEKALFKFPAQHKLSLSIKYF